MADALTSPAPALAELSQSLTQLRDALQPLLSRPFDELVEKLEGGSSVVPTPTAVTADATGEDGKGKGKVGEGAKDELAGMLDAARLRVSVAYVLLDAIWMYLKTKGVDPATHPVLGELERVKSYFAKIKHAQTHGKEEDRMHVDKSAAARFIRAALVGAGAGEESSEARAAAAPALQGVHKRFDFEEDESSGSDEEDSGEKSMEKSEEKAKAIKSEEKAKEGAEGVRTKKRKSDTKEEGKAKKGRRVMDPFIGYDETTKKKHSNESEASLPAAADSPSSSTSRKDKKKKRPKETTK